ncbi:hypothetical protein [Haloarchaeobius sp. DFWS5]|uniref:hypothetical protein n=1 Tax=Haloarchaeobius sp. DFWS5 TaxID=3446114 RepID=UPI003EBD2278
MVDDKTKNELNRIAHEKSEPGSTVGVSEIMREAFQLYIQQYTENPDFCDPSKRGGVELEIEEGAA